MTVVHLDTYRPTQPVELRRAGVDADLGKRTAPARRTARQRFAASQFAADLRHRSFLIGCCAGVLLAYTLADLAVALHHLMHGAHP